MRKCKHEFKLYRNTNYHKTGYISFFCTHCLAFARKKAPTIEDPDVLNLDPIKL